MRVGIRTKILAGYFIILALLCSVAATGIIGLNNIDKSYSHILDRRIPVTTTIMNLDSLIKDEIIQVRGFMIYRNESSVKELENVKNQIANYKNELEPILTTAKGRELFKKISNAEEKYYTNSLEIIKYYRTYNDEAAKPYIDTAVEAIGEFKAATNELIELNEKLIDDEIISAREKEKEGKLITYVVAVIALILGTGIGVYFGQKISNPVVILTSLAQKIANGDLTVKVPYLKTGDELETLGMAFQTMISNLKGMVQQINTTSQSVAVTSQQLSGNSQEATNATQQVAAAIEQVAKGSTDQSKSLTDTVQVMQQVSQSIEQIASGAQEQSRNVINTTEMVDGMVNMVNQMAEGMEQVRQISDRNGVTAAEGGKSVENTVTGMLQLKESVFETAKKINELGEQSQKIGEIIQVIDDIAEQTNLLALNAAIEAARAGEHGKGFAVVADEVRKLAERSGKATKEIAELITDMQAGTKMAVDSMQVGTEQVEKGVELAKEAGNSLGEIVEGVQNAGDNVNRIMGIINEILKGSQEVSEAINNVAAITEENTASTEEMSASAEQVNASMQNVASVSEENASASEEVSASTEELTASVEEIFSSSQQLASMAQQLQDMVTKFRV